MSEFSDWSAEWDRREAALIAAARDLEALRPPAGGLDMAGELLDWRERVAGLYDAPKDNAEAGVGLDRAVSFIRSALLGAESSILKLLRGFEASLAQAARQDVAGLACPDRLPRGSVQIVDVPNGVFPRTVARVWLRALPDGHWLKILLPDDESPGFLELGPTKVLGPVAMPGGGVAPFAVPLEWYNGEAIKRRTQDAKRNSDAEAESRRLVSEQLTRQARAAEEARRKQDQFGRLDELEKQLAQMGPAATTSR
jgi:hypothetical protein